jgi:hypothetical protein
VTSVAQYAGRRPLLAEGTAIIVSGLVCGRGIRALLGVRLQQRLDDERSRRIV